jgi:hypothetical protein
MLEKERNLYKELISKRMDDTRDPTEDRDKWEIKTAGMNCFLTPTSATRCPRARGTQRRGRIAGTQKLESMDTGRTAMSLEDGGGNSEMKS